MFESFKNTTDAESAVLRKLRVWIAASCLLCMSPPGQYGRWS